jgi:hypothetical protein
LGRRQKATGDTINNILHQAIKQTATDIAAETLPRIQQTLARIY